MKTMCALALFVSCAGSGFAQLTPDQKVSDFQHLAGLYAKNYAPHEWKLEYLKYDLLNIGPWLERVRASKDDLDFYEVMAEYVASLNDAHDSYSLPSNFVARLNFNCDIYDGKVLVDSIDRLRLPATEFPFQIGYEVVSVDGKKIEEILDSLMKYSVAANPRSTRREAAAQITFRAQSIMPHAIELADIAIVEMRRLDGRLEIYRIPWTKTGLPLVSMGPVPTPSPAPLAAAVLRPPPDEPDYMAPLRALQHCELPRQVVLGMGSRIPRFALPDGFVRRLGGSSSDFFYSGTFAAGGYRIGFIRIPSYGPPDQLAAIDLFRKEMAYFEANTDGLVIDEMRNPGGSVSFVDALLQLVIPYRFRTMGFQIRATSGWLYTISSALESAKAQNAPQWTIDLLTAIQEQIQSANREFRGLTGPLPLAGVSLDLDPAQDATGKTIAYTKPLIVLADEFSASGGDYFPAVIQDNRRGPIFGMRTMGAGGSVGAWYAGNFSEGVTSLTMSLMVRKEPVVTPDYPVAPYVENIGVRPDIVEDFMTRENLLNEGRPFANAFVAAIVEQIRKSR